MAKPRHIHMIDGWGAGGMGEEQGRGGAEIPGAGQYLDVRRGVYWGWGRGAEGRKQLVS